jgi:hypothetical protein
MTEISDDQFQQTYDGILREALSSEYGILVSTSNPGEAHALRRRLYWERTKARGNGDTKFDGLAMIKQGYGDLLIIKRPEIPESSLCLDWPIHQLRPEQIPRVIRSRGPRRLGIVEQIVISQRISDGLAAARGR